MRIVMMGTGTFAEPTFEALIAARENVVGLVTQPDRDTGRKGGSTRQTGKGMATIAHDAGIPVFQPESINTPEGMAELRGLSPDLLVVAAYGQILKPEVLEIPTQGAINVHASLLPKFRGASPVAHAILAGEHDTGVTIIRITPGLDAGDMLAKESVEILPEETTGELEARLAPVGARLALDVIQRLQAGPVEGERQDPAAVTRAPKFKKDHGLINWSRPASEIARLVRAMQPWPTAYTFFHRPGKEPMRVIIARVRKLGVIEGLPPEPTAAGMLLAFDPNRLVVPAYAGNSSIEILELQPAGKKKMTAEEFLRGYPIQDGYRFGPEVLG